MERDDAEEARQWEMGKEKVASLMIQDNQRKGQTTYQNQAFLATTGAKTEEPPGILGRLKQEVLHKNKNVEQTVTEVYTAKNIQKAKDNYRFWADKVAFLEEHQRTRKGWEHDAWQELADARTMATIWRDEWEEGNLLQMQELNNQNVNIQTQLLMEQTAKERRWKHRLDMITKNKAE